MASPISYFPDAGKEIGFWRCFQNCSRACPSAGGDLSRNARGEEETRGVWKGKMKTSIPFPSVYCSTGREEKLALEG
jgi:hypothetical protein